MLSIEIDYSRVIENSKPLPDLQKQGDGSTQLISTPNGFALLEIQGTLILPTKVTSDHEVISIEDVNKLVKFGNMEIDGNKLTLFIGTSQRLLGTVEKIDPPFGLLKFPVVDEEKQPQGDQKVEMVSIIDKRVVFRNRPLPIM